jgi:hypothetical protein
MTEIDEFWSARPVLAHIHQLARARRAGPWATLLVALARARVTIPPSVALPGTVGGRMSLNLFVAPVGPSGGGKGAAEAAAGAGIRFTNGNIEPIPVGSGEGVARTFRPAGTKPDDPNPVSSALFTAPEVDSLAALSARTGSTLSAELRKLYSGEPIGFANAGKDTRNIVPAHTYAASFIVGVQPLRSDALLGGADGGLPQRFIFGPVSDPDAPEEPPDDPGVWTVKVPAWTRSGAGHLSVVDDTQRDLVIPERTIGEIRDHRLAVLREDPDVDPLDGHKLLTQLKAAAALMALDGRTVVSDEDWALAAVLMQVSAHTRDRCRQVLRDHHRTINTARALATADRDEIVSDRKLQRAKQAILRWLGKLTELPAADLRQKLKADLRHDFGAAAAELAAEGAICEIRVKNGVRYRLAAEGTGVPEVHPPYSQVNDGVPGSTGVPAGTVADLDSRRSTCPDCNEHPARSDTGKCGPCTKTTMTAGTWLICWIRANAGHNGWVNASAAYAEGTAIGYQRGAIKVARQAASGPRIEASSLGRGAMWRIVADAEETTA